MNLSMSDVLSAAECVFGFTAACTCELLYVCAASTVSSLGSGGNDDSVIAGLERSHVLGGATGPLIPIGQSGRMLGAGRPWERPCRGLRDGEGTGRRAHRRGR